MQVTHLKAAPGVLLEAPVFEGSKRGLNWVAIIGIDATKPGGLSRRFLPRGRGICLYQTEQLAVGDPVEFGADYISTSGNRYRERWYGVVKKVQEEEVVLEHLDTSAAAISRAAEIRRRREVANSSPPVKPEDKPVCPTPDPKPIKTKPPTTSATRSRSSSGRRSSTANRSSRR